MKTIKDYIQFAIDNDFRFKSLQEWEPIEAIDIIENKNIYINFDDWWCAYMESLIEVITSKPYIEAIARGLWYKEVYEWLNKDLIDSLTEKQAIHISEWTLEEFIINLLWK